jgi:hypothetical protein
MRFGEFLPLLIIILVPIIRNFIRSQGTPREKRAPRTTFGGGMKDFFENIEKELSQLDQKVRKTSQEQWTKNKEQVSTNRVAQTKQKKTEYDSEESKTLMYRDHENDNNLTSEEAVYSGEIIPNGVPSIEINRSNLIRSIVMVEVLGPPRARKKRIR